MTKTPHPADTAGLFVSIFVFGQLAIVLAFVGFGLAKYSYLTLPLALLIATLAIYRYWRRQIGVDGEVA